MVVTRHEEAFVQLAVAELEHRLQAIQDRELLIRFNYRKYDCGDQAGDNRSRLGWRRPTEWSVSVVQMRAC